MDLHIEHLFGNLFYQTFKEYFSANKRPSSTSWDLYKKTHNIKTKLDNDTAYCDVILNPMGGNYYVPETFVTQAVSFKYVPPLVELPELDIPKLNELVADKFLEIKSFNDKTQSFWEVDSNWKRYLSQLGATIKVEVECRVGPYSSGRTYFEKINSREKIEAGADFDYIWIKSPVFNDHSKFGIEFEIAKNAIEKGMPPCDFELEKFKYTPNYRMMEEYQPW